MHRDPVSRKRRCHSLLRSDHLEIHIIATMIAAAPPIQSKQPRKISTDL